ncbi:unnamed protein product [marine sediment metagenome]|uniref:Uncharacterized protein n=1 Tax=marine sediment metagenome TaxID=412755 RepID=X1HR84_9ZZZZ
MGGERIRKWPFIVAGVFVCVAGAGAGGFFGALASLLYGMEDPHLQALGLGLGIAGGLLGGVVWCRVMLRAAQRYRGGSSGLGMVGWGTLWGIIVGLITTVIVHGGLMIAGLGRHTTGALESFAFWGLPFGVGAGAGTGLVCALIWWGVASLERRRGLQSADLDPTK